MSTHKNIDRICALITAVTLAIALIFCGIGSSSDIQAAARVIGYENRIFDTSRVHTVDLVINDREGFFENCENEEYISCTAVIDGEAVSGAGLRAKGNTSLRNVSSLGSIRYSFKIEFDRYDSSKSYHGLDKLCLNNIIQDNTYMKDYLAYTLMGSFGVASPLCSYAYITVNGEDFGLYLAVEAVEDSFMLRNFGGSGELYKPDSSEMGGGRGFGVKFDGNFEEMFEKNFDGGFGGNADSKVNGNSDENPGGNAKMPMNRSFGAGHTGFQMGSSDVKLQYIDDDPDSYPNIFDNAKTKITESDKLRLIASLKALSECRDMENTVDTDRVMRYFAVHNFLCNGDSYTGRMIHNYYLREYEGRLSMIPWDYNLAFGAFDGINSSDSVNAPIDTPVSGDMSDRPMISWIFSDEGYTEQYHALLSEFIETDFEALIDETAALISEYVEKDPTKFCTYEEFEKGVSAARSFCALRRQSIRGQLSGEIPSTSSGQSADRAALIDCSGLTLSDMGSMGGMGGMRNGKAGGMMPVMGNMPQMPGGSPIGEVSDGLANADNSDFPGNTENIPQSGFTPPDISDGRAPQGFENGGNSGFPGAPQAPFGENNAARPNMGTSPEEKTAQIPLLIISAVVLVIGIAAAALFKR